VPTPYPTQNLTSSINNECPRQKKNKNKKIIIIKIKIKIKIEKKDECSN
jgi:hypothetical protein